MGNEENNRFALTLINSMLFRLASYCYKSGKPGDRLVNWSKVQGWSNAQARSTDDVEISKVEYLKVQLLLVFVTCQLNKPASEEVEKVIELLFSGIHTVLQGNLSEGKLTSASDILLLRKTLLDRQKALHFV